MKCFVLLLLGGALGVADASAASALSSGNYRIPYAKGTQVEVAQDHLTHDPPDRIDLLCTNAGPNPIVAAADGVIRFIVDSNFLTCASCAVSNNYVWIEHANGEWTKYSHMQTWSTTLKAGLSVGKRVVAGQYLGDEDDVGAASGKHLHFEVAVPDDLADPIVPAGGFIKGVNRVPVICGIPGNLFVQGASYIARDCQAPEFSYGVYRIPYANGTQVSIGGDHLTHNPATRIDMSGTGARGPFRVVAAADGIIRFIVDSNFLTCSACAVSNNYVWIEHPNGEWTKYSHMQTGTTKGAAGLAVGQQVCAGTYLGDEDDVGKASGKHLHWEVAVPDDPADPIDPAGGFIKGKNRIPILCDIPGNIFVDGQTYTADPCSTTDCGRQIFLTPQIVYGAQVQMSAGEIDSNNSAYRIDTYASVAFRAANRIVLRPGFRAVFNSYLHAALQSCNEMPGLGGCNLLAPGANP